MKKYISILSCFMGSVLLGLTACSDEVTPLPSLPEEGEPVGVTLTLYLPQAEQVAVTRADADEDAVTELCLLVFPSAGDEAVLEQAQTFTSGELTGVGTTTTVRKQFKVTLEASSEEKYLYVVANDSSLWGAIEKGKTTLGAVRTLTTDADQAPFVMSGRVQSKIPDVKLVTQDIPLIRTVAQLTMEDESNNEHFIYTGFALYGGTTEGSLLAGADTEGYTPFPGSEDNHSTIKNTPLYTYPWYV